MLKKHIQSAMSTSECFVNLSYVEYYKEIDDLDKLIPPIKNKNSVFTDKEINSIVNGFDNYWYLSTGVIRRRNGAVLLLPTLNQDIIDAVVLARSGVNIILSSNIHGSIRDYIMALAYAVNYTDERPVSVVSTCKSKAKTIHDKFDKDLRDVMYDRLYCRFVNDVQLSHSNIEHDLHKGENPLHLLLDCELEKIESIDKYFCKVDGSVFWHLTPEVTTTKETFNMVSDYIEDNTVPFSRGLLAMSPETLNVYLEQKGKKAVFIRTDIDDELTKRTLGSFSKQILLNDTILKIF